MDGILGLVDALAPHGWVRRAVSPVVDEGVESPIFPHDIAEEATPAVEHVKELEGTGFALESAEPNGFAKAPL